jgi:hypothetical protein
MLIKDFLIPQIKANQISYSYKRLKEQKRSKANNIDIKHKIK